MAGTILCVVFLIVLMYAASSATARRGDKEGE